MTLMPMTLPGMDSPIEMLAACHQKVRHFARLSSQLAVYLDNKGADAMAQETARNILRYFDIAGPLHHQDEEQDLFPALRAAARASGDAPAARALCGAIDEVQAEHVVLDGLWADVRNWLERVELGYPDQAPEGVEIFAVQYPMHAGREEAEIYVHASLLTESQLARIGRRMSERRGLRCDASDPLVADA